MDAGGGARAADGRADGRGGAAGDGQGAGAVAVNVAAERGAADGLDVAHVGAAGEDGVGERSEGGSGAGGGGRSGGTAVAGRDEAGGDGETDGAAGAAVDVVGITTLDGGKGAGHLVDGDDLELVGGESDLGGQRLGVGDAGREGLEDELVGGNVDVVGGDAGLSRVGGESLDLLNVHVVKSALGLLKLGDVVGDGHWGGTSAGHLGGQGSVGDGDVDGLAILGDPGTSEGGAGQGLDLVDDAGGSDLTGDTGSGLGGVETQVALHGSQDLGVQVARSLSGSTVGNGQDGCQKGEEAGELHLERYGQRPLVK